MPLSIVKAGRLHVSDMATLLNEVIEAGGTTAIGGPVSGEMISDWMAKPRSAWNVAEDEGGKVLGFQWIAPAEYLPAEAAEIATFAKIGKTGLGIGSRLLEQTVISARSLGYEWINANIRADNVSGLTYYRSRGFEDYGRIENHELPDGQKIDKILKRLDII